MNKFLWEKSSVTESLTRCCLGKDMFTLTLYGNIMNAVLVRTCLNNPCFHAGLEVFEVVLVLWLGATVQDEAALLAAALSYRVVFTMGDALAAAGAWGVKGWWGKG